MGNFIHSQNFNIYSTQNKEGRQLLRKRDEMQKAGIFQVCFFLLNGMFLSGKHTQKEKSEGAVLKKTPQTKNQQPPKTKKKQAKKQKTSFTQTPKKKKIKTQENKNKKQKQGKVEKSSCLTEQQVRSPFSCLLTNLNATQWGVSDGLRIDI